MSSPHLNELLARLRAALPDRAEALRIAHELTEPIDPVVAAYLHAHTGFWRPDVGSALDIGPVRQHQEDGVFLSEPGRAFVVIDGMGGQASGDIATRRIIMTLEDHFPYAWGGEPLSSAEACPLMAALVNSDEAIRMLHKIDPMCQGQGATVAGVFVADRTLHIAHVGDSRVYRLRRGKLELLTWDHSLINEFDRLIEAGEASTNQILSGENRERYRNIITKAVGVDPHGVEPDWSCHPIEPGDAVLLCTDGLWKAVPEEAIQALLGAAGSSQARAQALVDAAIEANTNDNVAVIVVQFPRRSR